MSRVRNHLRFTTKNVYRGRGEGVGGINKPSKPQRGIRKLVVSCTFRQLTIYCILVWNVRHVPPQTSPRTKIVLRPCPGKVCVVSNPDTQKTNTSRVNFTVKYFVRWGETAGPVPPLPSPIFAKNEWIAVSTLLLLVWSRVTRRSQSVTVTRTCVHQV